MKISKKIIIIGSVLLTICIVISIILINANKNKEDLISNIIEKEEIENLDVISEQGNNNEIDNEIANIINNDDIQTIDKDESMDIVEQKTYDEKIVDNNVKPKQETTNKTITTNNSSNKTNNQSSNTNQTVKSSKQEEIVTETKVPEKTTEPESKPSTPQVESNPVVEKQEETKQEETKQEEPKQEETVPTETKPSRTYKINTTYINKLKQTVITEVTNNLDKLNKYGITSVEQYKIIDDDSSMCTFNGGNRSGWTYENPSAYATFKSSILKGTSIKIYAVDEYQNGVYIQTLCYYGH